MRIGILGGSFDPVHIGHLWVAQQVLERTDIDDVWIMPCYSAMEWNKKLSPATFRLSMCRLACVNFGFTVSAVEVRQAHKYTYQTIDFLTKEHPRYKFSWVVGSDWDMRDFKNAEMLLEKCNYIEVSRPKHIQTQEGRDGYGEQRLTFGISSSEIRRRVKAGLPIRGLVLPTIEDYIKAVGLYK